MFSLLYQSLVILILYNLAQTCLFTQMNINLKTKKCEKIFIFVVVLNYFGLLYVIAERMARDEG